MIQPSSDSENAPIKSVEAVPFTSHTPRTSIPIARYTINAVMTRPESFVVIPPASKMPALACPADFPPPACSSRRTSAMVKPRAEAVSELSDVDSAPAAQTTAPFSLGAVPGTSGTNTQTWISTLPQTITNRARNTAAMMLNSCFRKKSPMVVHSSASAGCGLTCRAGGVSVLAPRRAQGQCPAHAVGGSNWWMPSGVYVASVEGMVTDDVFAVIAEATRRDILVSLRKGDKAVGELVQELEASQPTISKHLKVLREADLVSMRAQGQKRYYTLNPKPLAGIASWLQTFDVGPAATAATRDRHLRRHRRERRTTGSSPSRTALAARPPPPRPRRRATCRSARRPARRQPAEPRRRLPVGTAGEDKMPQQIGRTVGRAATKAADLLANLPEVRPQEVTLPVCGPHHPVLSHGAISGARMDIPSGPVQPWKGLFGAPDEGR